VTKGIPVDPATLGPIEWMDDHVMVCDCLATMPARVGYTKNRSRFLAPYCFCLNCREQLHPMPVRLPTEFFQDRARAEERYLKGRFERYVDSNHGKTG
jgi:hypothetical protein